MLFIVLLFDWIGNDTEGTSKPLWWWSFMFVAECLEVYSGPKHCWTPDSQWPSPGLAFLHSPDWVWPAADKPVRPSWVWAGQAGQQRILPAALEDVAGCQHTTWHPHCSLSRYKETSYHPCFPYDSSGFPYCVSFFDCFLKMQMLSISAAKSLLLTVRGCWPVCLCTLTSSSSTSCCRGELVSFCTKENLIHSSMTGELASRWCRSLGATIHVQESFGASSFQKTPLVWISP